MNKLSIHYICCQIIAISILAAIGSVSYAKDLPRIVVDKYVKNAYPIAIVPFALEGVGELESLPTDIIEFDLASSGQFNVVSSDQHLSRPSELQEVKYKDWTLLKVEALVIGQVINIGNGQLEVRFRLLDVYRGKQLIGKKFTTPANKLRKVAHQISNIIYESLLQIPGAFDTKLAYVTVEGTAKSREYSLQIADADGYGPATILQSAEPILSPAWSPSGNMLAYVSFEKKRSMIYVQNVWNAKRRLISEHQGINSAPAWSPDGRSLAVTLSKDGNSEIYIYSMDNESLRRLTRNAAIDTEPTWSPDGQTIAFSSGRGGAAQIYSIPVAGGNAQRLTYDGKYNAGPSYSPDGKTLSLITDQGNGFRVGIYSFANRSVTELTTTTQDESPTFAPNGEMIIYATQKGGRNVLAAVSRDGNVQQTLRFQQSSVREPAWSPFNRKL